MGKAQGELDSAVAREANPEIRAANIVKAVETALRKATKFATEVAPSSVTGAGGATDADAAVQKAQEFGIRSVVDLVKAKVDAIMDELEKEKQARVLERAAAAAAAKARSTEGTVIEEAFDVVLEAADANMSDEQFARELDRRLAAKREKLIGDFATAKRAKTTP